MNAPLRPAWCVKPVRGKRRDYLAEVTYVVVNPGEAGNPSDRWRVVEADAYAKGVQSGRRPYVFAAFGSREAAQARADRLNAPLYPPTEGPEHPFRDESATPAEIALAARTAQRRKGETPRFDRPIFDQQVTRETRTYEAFPAQLPEDRESM